MKKFYFLIIQIILIKVLSFFPDFVERFYSNGLYLYISNINRILFGWIPISVGDFAYMVLILLVFVHGRAGNGTLWPSQERAKTRLIKSLGVMVIPLLLHQSVSQ